MFKIEENLELNQISLTGLRALVIVGLLIVAPRTLEEIRRALINYKIIEESHSDDILRIDLNTIKAMGCRISRASAKTNYKYILRYHPFALEIDDDEVKYLKRLYNKMKSKVDVETLIDFHYLFTKIADYIYNDDIKNKLYGISALRRINLERLKDLVVDCQQERMLTLLYKKSANKDVEEKEIIAKKLVFENDKVYLYGYDTKKEASVVLNYERIKKIVSRRLSNESFEPDLIKIKYYLKDFGVNVLSDEEVVLQAGDDGYIIEGNYYNEFLALQRILSFGASCTVLEPLSFRNKVIAKLKEMRNVYGL